MSYNEGQVLSVLTSALGQYKKIKDEYVWHCPKCHHHKPKLQVNIGTGNFHCWVCNFKGRSLYSLLKQLNVPLSVIKELKIDSYSYAKESMEKESTVLTLPREFISLKKANTDLDYNSALFYLKNRNISKSDIIKYNIGYCSEGDYRGRIIIPSYDERGNLNYFLARSYWPDTTMKYKNPPVSAHDIIVFDLFINWNEAIILCEGIFDAIAIKRNAIPLLGKFVSTILFDKIMTKNVPEVKIALDSDARQDALKIYEMFSKENVKTTIVKLDEKDPSDVGFSKMNHMVENSVGMGFSDFIRNKLL